MKTKRTFVKLFVMACFLAVLWSGNTKAASPTTLTMGNKDIYIGYDKVGYGDPNNPTAFTEVTSDINDGYIITGSTMAGGHNLIINLNAGTNLSLTFRIGRYKLRYFCRQPCYTTARRFYFNLFIQRQQR